MFRAASHRGSLRRLRAHTFDGHHEEKHELNTGQGRQRHYSESGTQSSYTPRAIPFRRQSVPVIVATEEMEPVPENWVTNIDVMGIKVKPSARFMYVIQVTWNKGETTQIVREYEDFFNYHCWVLDTFRVEAGALNKNERTIPYLPGRKLFRRNSLTLAEERQPLLAMYMKQLVKLPCVTRSGKAQAFFCWRPGDPKPSHDPVVFAVNEEGENGRLQSVKVQVLAGLNKMGEKVEEESLLNAPKDMDGCHENASFSG